MQHFTVRFLPDHRSVTIHHGTTLLEAAGQAGITLTSPCGGAGRCAKCKVQLLPGGKEVLACQCAVEHDLEVRVPEQSRLGRQQILQHGVGRAMPLEPLVRKVFVPGAWAGLEAFCANLSQTANSCVHTDFSAAEQNTLEAAGCAAAAGATAVLFETHAQTRCDGATSCFRLAAIEPGDTTALLYGVAVDIGTTTVVASLIDLNTGKTAAVSSCGNPQSRYGADVISRIQMASTDDGAATLQQAILGGLDKLIGQAAESANIPRMAIYEVVAAGNTTMNHLLLRLPVVQLGQAPYHAYSLEACDKNAAEMMLSINPCGQLHTIENIAGFVGSDTVAAALAGGMDKIDAPTMVVDIGTNGEIVLGVGDKLWAASCAAGPALEGAGIAFGSPAQDGAIQRVLINETDIDIDVIGGTAVRSICGSGLIDAVAVLLDLGVVDETGRFVESEAIFPPLKKAIAARLTMYDNQPAFVFSPPGANDTVLLNQRDIRQFQLAKAAIRAGIQLLCEEAELPEDKLSRILLAGAFGNYIQRESAVRVGLLPGPSVERIRFIGNAAGAGASMALTSRHARKLATHIARHTTYLEIAHQARFQDAFSMCLLFPEPQ